MKFIKLSTEHLEHINQEFLLSRLQRIDANNNLSAWQQSHYMPSLLLDNDIWLMLSHVNAEKPQVINVETIAGFAITKSVLDEAELLLIVVDSAWQQQGNGRKLLQRAINGLQAEKINAFFLEVNVDNLGAIKLYESCNFKAVNIRKNYYRHNHNNQPDQTHSRDALVMKNNIACL